MCSLEAVGCAQEGFGGHAEHEMGGQAARVCLPGISAWWSGYPGQRRECFVHDHEQCQPVQGAGSGAHRWSFPACCCIEGAGQHSQRIVKQGRARSRLLIGRAHPADLRGLFERAGSGSTAWGGGLHRADLLSHPGFPSRIFVARCQVPGKGLRVFVPEHEPPDLVHGPDAGGTCGCT